MSLKYQMVGMLGGSNGAFVAGLSWKQKSNVKEAQSQRFTVTFFNTLSDFPIIPYISQIILCFAVSSFLFAETLEKHVPSPARC